MASKKKKGQRPLRSTKRASPWIKKAIKRPGALTKKARKAGMSPMSFAQKNMHAKGRTGNQARMAMTLAKMRRGMK